MWNLNNNGVCSVKGWIPLQETSLTGYTSFTHLGGSFQRAIFLMINFTLELQREIIKSQEINPNKKIIVSFGIFILIFIILLHNIFP